MHILFIDDEKIANETVTRGLQILGHTVEAFHNSVMAMEKLHNAPESFDLVITDYVMPGMDGLELLKVIRENYSWIPVIMTTAFTSNETRDEAKRLGCMGFIEKPFTPDRLDREIRRVIDLYYPEKHRLADDGK
jgi:DNA-binding NtrC family response regulator